MFHSIYIQPLWLIVLLIILIPCLWHFLAMLIMKYQNKLWCAINIVVLFLSTTVILYITLFGRHSTIKEIVSIPFYSFVEAQQQPEMYRTMLMNVFLFVPLGMSLPFVLPVRWKHTMIITVLLAFILSVGIESLQYILSIGRCEVDDVIMNMLGAFIGSCAFLKIRKKSGYAESDK